MPGILTTKSVRWGEFLDKMMGPEGLHVRPGADGTPEWDCTSDTACPVTAAILKRMGGINVPATLRYFRGLGGNCDCEIMLNLDPGDADEEEL